MEIKSLEHFRHSVEHIESSTPWAPELQLFSDSKLSVYYAPFEHINQHAKVVICGITPGKTQAIESLTTAKSALQSSGDLNHARALAKQAASFKGFRATLSAMLDLIGVNKRLGIKSCHELFSDKADLVHYTSALCYPVVLANGGDYNGTPKARNHPYLRDMLDTYLEKEVEVLGENCLWIPLGQGATEALEYLLKKGALKPKQLISGLPHPSGANAESISLILEEIYPTLDGYCERMYRDYMDKRSWEKRANGKPQSEAKYKATRKARWQKMLAVRHQYGIEQ